MTKVHYLALALCGLCVSASCGGSADGAGSVSDVPGVDSRLFTKLPSSYTGVRFANRLEDSQELNVFTYRNYYNGGGVALGDVSGDGRPDLFLTSNLEGNALYLNEGAFRFRDVTREAGVRGKGAWATGVTFADVNGDGRLDIYVCYAGKVPSERRANELYINDGAGPSGIPTFTESAREYGLADDGYATHAAFLDYDRDGDLDLYVVNNSFRPVNSFGLGNIRHVRHAHGGDKLLRNDGGRFTDVSEQAGIYGSEIAFGLGVAVGDVNRDGWPDLYVSNDFFERDYLYINRGDGTFAESLEQQMPYISYFSMGLDIADINNDGWPDVYVTDMLPEGEQRLKTTSSFEGWSVYQAKLENGYHHQFMRNMLHLNNGNGTFSDIGQMAGVARTDWSWSALIADYDLDGFKDIYVTNGLARDVTSQDYVAFLADEQTLASATKGRRVDFARLVNAMSSTKLPDYAFRNGGDLTFSNESAAWGLNTGNFSNGAAYGDLDGDGALDLVVNNVNEEAFVYRNNARTLLNTNSYLQVRLDGEGMNRFGIGAKVTVQAGKESFVQELFPSRGFQSSVDYVLTFGVGKVDTLDLVTVDWPDGRVNVIQRVAANQRIVVRQSASQRSVVQASRPAVPAFSDVTRQAAIGFTHSENEFVDFERERLMPKMLSTEGPFLAIGDVNADGRDDAFIGGARDQAGQLLLQAPDGTFSHGDARVFQQDKISEDIGAAFFDADADGDLDLYVVSGGSEYSDSSPALQDRLYLNDGRGGFRKAEGYLPAETTSGSRVIAADYDDDGDIDLFVGGRVVPWRYGMDPKSALLSNDGQGRFSDVTARLAPAVEKIGMVTDAVWSDVDRDGRVDLVVVGEWMPIAVFRNAGGGKLVPLATPGLDNSHGWWNRIVAGDFTGDGRTDFIVGNLGLNTRLRATPTEPATMHVADFDRNGFVEQVISYYNGGASYPVALRDDLIEALPYLKARYPTYEKYAGQTTEDIFTAAPLHAAVLKKAHTFATSLVRNNADGSFTLVPLPIEAQVAPVYGILADDLDADGKTDLLLAGNFDGVQPEYGRMSASQGLFLRGDGKGNFEPVSAQRSGFVVPGEARDIQRVRSSRRAGDRYIVARNDDHPLVFRPNVRRNDR